MSQSPLPDQKVERTKPVEWLTLVLLVVGGLWQGWKYVFVEQPQQRFIQRKLEIEANLAAEESVSVDGEVLAPDLYHEGIPFCPVVVKIKNRGQVPVDIEEVDFRVFIASLKDVTIIEDAASKNAKPRGTWPEEGPQVGIIDYNSDAWVEKVNLSQKPSGRLLPAGQEHTERFHLLSPRDISTVATRVNVVVKTKIRTYRWSGFANPMMCRVAYPGEDIFSAPIQATEATRPDATIDVQARERLSLLEQKATSLASAIDGLSKAAVDSNHPGEAETNRHSIAIDHITTKSITIVSTDGGTVVGRISAEPVSIPLVTNDNKRQPKSSLAFEIGTNSQQGGSVIVRHPQTEPNAVSAIGVEIRAWKNQAAAMIVNDKGQAVSGSMIWTRSSKSSK